MPGFEISGVPFPPAPTPCPNGVGPKMPLNADVGELSVSCGATASKYPCSIWGVKPTCWGMAPITQAACHMSSGGRNPLGEAGMGTA